MNLIPWRAKRQGREGDGNGGTPLVHLHDEIDRLFDRAFEESLGPQFLESGGPGWALEPRLDLTESENEVTITTEVPGVEPKDVEISVSGDSLTIRGEKKQEREEKKRSYHSVERSFGSFQRTVRLPSSVDASKVDATYKNGILTVVLKKDPAARPKRIAVKTG
jgi:HSP20 family protein